MRNLSSGLIRLSEVRHIMFVISFATYMILLSCVSIQELVGPMDAESRQEHDELEQRMKHEREEMDSVVMLHRTEMYIKLREERASLGRALKGGT
ncbi:unnamed protein product [Miscanthus lutarioriparius]|uniref:Uncharacterized protein n=1 Tax=Miscanthus lutarioriparius TaxID=422564 RepID=A0A811P3L7_9POAL|nr:unnamed protein product [Miscanthus lutarioriparius]